MFCQLNYPPSKVWSAGCESNTRLRGLQSLPLPLGYRRSYLEALAGLEPATAQSRNLVLCPLSYRASSIYRATCHGSTWRIGPGGAGGPFQRPIHGTAGGSLSVNPLSRFAPPSRGVSTPTHRRYKSGASDRLRTCNPLFTRQPLFQLSYAGPCTYIYTLYVFRNWSGREDSNLRHPGSKPGTLAGLSYTLIGGKTRNRT